MKADGARRHSQKVANLVRSHDKLVHGGATAIYTPTFQVLFSMYFPSGFANPFSFHHVRIHPTPEPYIDVDALGLQLHYVYIDLYMYIYPKNQSFHEFHVDKYTSPTVDGRNPAPVEVGSFC